MGTTVNGIYVPADGEVGWGAQVSANQRRLADLHINVKAFGAVGDGVADDTAEIQAAITQGRTAGHGEVYLPPGDYLITSALDITGPGGSVKIRGSHTTNPGVVGNNGTRITGNFTGPLINRTETGDVSQVIIEDLALKNTHASGKGIEFAGLQAPSGIYRCSVLANKGIVFKTNCFNAVASNCHVARNGSISGSIGIELSNHTAAYSCDVSFFGTGVYFAGAGSTLVSGGRIEVNQVGIYIDGPGSGFISAISFEANDTAIWLHHVQQMFITGIGILGTSAAPSGFSQIGIQITEVHGALIGGISEGGSHTTAFIQIDDSPGTRENLALIAVKGNTAWTIGGGPYNTTITNCSPEQDVTKAPVIATASLPAAATAQNGRLVIEDNGTGDRNLILYAGGQRFRIDGGASF